MKQSSKEANKRAESFKESHKKKILKALIDSELTAQEIAYITGLDKHAVSRRTGELERESKIYTIQELPVCVYKLTTKEMKLLSMAQYERKRFERWQKQALKMGKFVNKELINIIQAL